MIDAVHVIFYRFRPEQELCYLIPYTACAQASN